MPSNSTSGPRVVTDATPEQLDALLASERDRLIVVYLWGPDCPNCDFFASRLPSLLESLAEVEFLLIKLDVYAYPAVARRYGVYGIPHFLLFKNGTRLGKMSEFRGDTFWTSVVREHL